jgi:hypothetical protein
MSKKEKTELAVVEENHAALAVFQELESDGLEAAGAEERRLPTYVWNMAGEKPDQFFDTLQEDQFDVIECALLSFSKSNEWRSYNPNEDGSKVECRSTDRVTGQMADGTFRACHGCSDALWVNDPKTGKRKQNCGMVYNVIGLDLVKETPFLIRFRKTSSNPFKNFLAKFFVGRRKFVNESGKTELRNWPLFTWNVTIGLELAESKKYAIPTFEIGQAFTADKIKEYAEQSAFLREQIVPLVEKDEAVRAAESPAPSIVLDGSGTLLEDGKEIF